MINKTFRLFISSTFNDFISERNILNDKVFAKVDNYCQQYGYNFQLIDLRWGVNNESALNQNTLAICLDEVRRCRTMSPKPNFLIMAGERYGWIPLPAKLSKQDFSQIISVASPKEKQILTEWYILDENEIGGEYYLKMRSGKYTNDDVWSKTEANIYASLLNCVSNIPDMSEEKVKMITSSATEQEIFEGLLNYEGISNNTIVVIRNNYPYSQQDENKVKIENLKKRIIQKMSDDGCEENVLKLEWDSSYCERFEYIVTEILIKNISLEIDRLSHERTAQNQSDEIEQIFACSGLIFDRPTETEKISQYLNSDSNKPLFLYGDSGSGKTTLLSQLIKNNKQKFFYAFYGWSENHYTLISTIESIVDEIKDYYSINREFGVDESNISETFFAALYSIPSDESAVIVIDGMDMFHDISEIKEKIIPSRLPANVKLIISSANKDVIGRFSSSTAQILELGGFNKAESKEYFEQLLKQKNRCISSERQAELVSRVIENGTTPLQLKLMAEECSMWRSDDDVAELSDAVENIAYRHLSNMYQRFGHNKELVLYTLALIATSPYGISEEEIQLLLLRFEPVKKYFVSEDRYEHKSNKLPFVIWSRLFYDLKGCLTLCRVKGFIVVKFAHQIFYRVFLKEHADYYNEALAVLISYYEEQNDYINEQKMPNVRKALSLAVLLRQSGQVNRMAELLCRLSYVDSVVKIGNVGEVITNLQFAINHIQNDSQKDYLKQIYNRLQKSRNMLNCYYNEFYTCFNNFLGINEKTIISVESENCDDNSLYFPYSVNSKIDWNDDGTKYAVYNNSYIYICEGETNTELGRIYLEPNDKEISVAKKVLWLGDNALAVVTFQNNILVYNLQNGTPNVLFEFQTDNDECCIKYSAKNKSLFFQKGKSIQAKDVYTGNELFHIDLKHKFCVEFEIDDSNNTLSVKDTVKYIRVFDASNGAFIKKERIKSKYGYFEFFDLLRGGGIHCIDASKWLACSESREKPVVYDTKENSRTYLYPPYYYDARIKLIGKQNMLIAYSDALLLVNLTEPFEMKWLSIESVKDVAWKKQDVSVSVLTNSGFKIFPTEDFKPLPEEIASCMHLKKNLFNSLFFTTKSFVNISNNIFPKLRMFRKLNNILDYEYVFLLADKEEMQLQNISRLNSTASIVITANDGKTAAAYEEENVIVVFNRENKPILQIDKLKLAICNDILKMKFSPNSEKLLIWRNDSIQIIDVNGGKIELELDLTWRPALDVDFSNDSEKIKLILCDETAYYCVISDGNKVCSSKLPQKLVSEPHPDAYVGPYSYYVKNDGTFIVDTFLDTIGFDLESTPVHWFKRKRVYRGKKVWLLFEDGEFYLNGDKKLLFSHELYDFDKCFQAEMLSESKPIRTYLNVKNDLFSELFEFNDKYLILITRMLNSVIIFDAEFMRVLSAYKIDGNIIGYVINREESYISVTVDREPYQMKLRINLPNEVK